MTSIFFAPLGAKAAHNINGKKLKKGFALFLLGDKYKPAADFLPTRRYLRTR
jgi:hypothetical protein